MHTTDTALLSSNQSCRGDFTQGGPRGGGGIVMPCVYIAGSMRGGGDPAGLLGVLRGKSA